MVAIRNRNTNVPHVFRYPRWEADIFYPAGSLVSYPIPTPDSEGAYWDFYVAKLDVAAADNIPPPDNFAKYKLIMSTSTVGDSEVNELLLNLDSDIRLVKSLTKYLINYDSDLKKWIDSEINERIENDSDIQILKRYVINSDSDIFKVLDSDIQTLKRFVINSDSDIFKALDSEINLLQNHDSDFLVKYDSDLNKTRHDFMAGDSDIRVNLDSDVRILVHNYLSNDSELDSDIKQLIQDYLAADSDQKLNSLNDVSYKDSELGVDIRTKGKVLGWDSDLSVWKPVEAASAVANLKDVNLTNLEQGDALVYDSDLQTWRPGAPSAFSKLPDLLDVNLENLRHGMTLGWDSDSELWKPQLSAATVPVNEQFLASQGQTDFTLAHQPIGNVLFVRNSMLINITAYSDSENVVIYNPVNNNNQIIQTGDRIEIRYNRLTSSIPLKILSDITFQDLSGPVDGGNAFG